MEQHESPLDEARSITVGQLTQFISLAGTAAQIASQRARERRAENAAQSEMMREQDRAERQRVIADRHRKWAPALDNTWLASADLAQVAKIWGDAMPVAADSPFAEEVVIRCENRFRKIHPHAMQHYDRLRSDGVPRAEAMVLAVPFFARDPNIRTGYPAPRRAALEPGREDAESTATQDASSPTLPPADPLERGGRRILEQMVREGNITDPSALRTALTVGTNMPPELIDWILARGGRVRSGSTAPTPGGARTETTPAARVAADFPLSVADSVKAGARRLAEGGSFSKVHRQFADQSPRPSNAL